MSAMLNAYDTWLTKPNHDLMSVRLCVWEVSDSPDVSLAWSYGITGDFETCEFDFVLGEAKFLRIKGDPTSAAVV